MGTNNKGADQPAHPRRLICAFVVRYSSFFPREIPYKTSTQNLDSSLGGSLPNCSKRSAPLHKMEARAENRKKKSKDISSVTTWCFQPNLIGLFLGNLPTKHCTNRLFWFLLFFFFFFLVVVFFFFFCSTKKLHTSFSHRVCHFRAIQPFDFCSAGMSSMAFCKTDDRFLHVPFLCSCGKNIHRKSQDSIILSSTDQQLLQVLLRNFTKTNVTGLTKYPVALAGSYG